MSEESQRTEDLDRVKRHCEQLAEHYDTVQIFVTSHMPTELNGTKTVSYGLGNWYARHGQAALWVEEHREYERIAARKFKGEDNQ